MVAAAAVASDHLSDGLDIGGVRSCGPLDISAGPSKDGLSPCSLSPINRVALIAPISRPKPDLAGVCSPFSREDVDYMSGLPVAAVDQPKRLPSVRSRLGLAGINSYPADERRISEVERGRCWSAILPLPAGKSLAPGDSIIFALACPDENRELCYISGGDSVRVFLTDVTDMASNDPATGQALFRLSWAPLGHDGSPSPSGDGALGVPPVRKKSRR